MPDEEVLNVVQIVADRWDKDSMQLFIFINGNIKDFVVEFKLLENVFLKIRYFLLLFFFLLSSFSRENQIVHIHPPQRILITLQSQIKYWVLFRLSVLILNLAYRVESTQIAAGDELEHFLLFRPH